MNMDLWVREQIATADKKAMPLLSYPAVQQLFITVDQLVNSSTEMALGVRLIADRYNMPFATTYMDLSVEAERARWKAAPLPTGREAPDAPRGAVDPTAHFLVLETEGRTADGRVFRHEATVALDVWKRCALPVSGLAIRRVAPAKDEKGAFDVELVAKAPAFFAWVADPTDARGRFSDNLVTVLPGAPRVIRYHPAARTTATALGRRLHLTDLRACW